MDTKDTMDNTLDLQRQIKVLFKRFAFDEVYDFQLERGRMQQAFERIENHEIILRKPSKLTPFAFPIFAESFRERYSNEDWETRLKRLKDDLTNV